MQRNCVLRYRTNYLDPHIMGEIADGKCEQSMNIYEHFMTVRRVITSRSLRKPKQITILLNGVIAIILTVCVCAFANISHC